MASSYTSQLINGEGITALNELLEPFGFTHSQLVPLLYKTSAVMAGGAVTHFLATRDPALGFRDVKLPVTSDLDFWALQPAYSTELSETCRVFNDLVSAEFMRLFEPLGYKLFSYPPRQGKNRDGKDTQDYLDCKAEFKTQGGINISVKWIYNEKTKRLINLIFTDKPIEETVSKFDLPISRAYINGSLYGDSRVVYDRQVLEDLKDHRLAPPDPVMEGKKTDERARKYMERYDLVPRESVVYDIPVVPDSVAVGSVGDCVVRGLSRTELSVKASSPKSAPLTLEIPPVPASLLDRDEDKSASPASPRKRSQHHADPLLSMMDHVIAKLPPSDPLFDEFVTKMEGLTATLKRVQGSLTSSASSVPASASASACGIPTVAEVAADTHQVLMRYVRENNLPRVEGLLDSPSVDPSLNGNEALLVACELGYVALVGLLLNHGDSSGTPYIDPSRNDNEALRLATANGHQEIVEMLMKHPRVKASVNAVSSKTLPTHTDAEKVAEWHRLLLHDVQLGYRFGVEKLLVNPLVDPSLNNNEALLVACELGYVEVVELLLKDPRVDPSASDNEAIRRASGFGHVAVVALLLKDPRVDPSLKA